MKHRQNVRSGGSRITTSRGKLSYALVAAVLLFVGGVLFAASQLDAARLLPSLPSPVGHEPMQRGMIDDFVQKTARVGSLVMENSENSSMFCSPWPLCALSPQEPVYFSLCDLLTEWSPDDPDITKYHFSRATQPRGTQSPLPVFDFSDPAELLIAKAWRKAEVPFLLKGVPDLDKARVLWGKDDAFLQEAFKSTKGYKVESAVRKSHFLYYSKPQLRGGGPSGEKKWEPPQLTENDISYQEFESIAKAADEMYSPGGGRIGEVAKSLYLTISAVTGGHTKWIAESLPFFRDDHDFFRVNYPEPFHGINCRFGMKGVVQAAHYDHGRNFIAMVKGHKRYVILPPRACESLELLSHGLPSARHASFDWADPEELRPRADKNFCHARATEIVLPEGQILYLPSFWFHYIVSLDRTAQCNSRAGNSDSGAFEINTCMKRSTTDKATGF